MVFQETVKWTLENDGLVVDDISGATIEQEYVIEYVECNYGGCSAVPGVYLIASSGSTVSDDKMHAVAGAAVSVTTINISTITTNLEISIGS